MVDYNNAYSDNDDNAQQIIAQVLTKINLSSNVVDNPFNTADQSNKEIISILNTLLVDLAKENEFTQVKHLCKFKVYSNWQQGENVEKGNSRIYKGIRYLCTNSGLSNVAPQNDIENEEFTMDETPLWAPNLEITVGTLINSNKTLYQAVSNGVSGTTQPEGTGIISDGGVNWQYVRSICYWKNKGKELNKYPLDEICPDFRSLCPGTIINKTATRKIYPLTDQQAQNLNVYNITTPSNFYQIREKSIFLYPTYNGNDEIEFYYYGKKMVRDKNGVLKKKFTENEDIPLIPSQVLIYGACYNWKMMKQADYIKYEELYKIALERALAENKEPVIVRIDGNANDNYSPVPFQDWVIGD